MKRRCATCAAPRSPATARPRSNWPPDRRPGATMQSEPLTFPHAAPPAPGEVAEIAPGGGVFRLKLPFQLNHVNIYLIRDDDGWLVLDTGLGTDDCRMGWDNILSGPLK